MVRARAAGTFCLECGYSLRGLAPGQPCPECGTSLSDEPQHPHASWARAVFCGLTLLLAVTAVCVCSVLVQPFEERGGTAPALNMPGPKLWAVPLVLRPLGSQPELPGVIGTLASMASLLAIWLITTPSELPRVQRFNLSRRAARWGSAIAFGGGFGIMMSLQGLYGGQLYWLRVLLIGCVELPGAILLYLYLRRLAEQVPGQQRKAAFDRLAIAVPLIVLGGLAGASAQWMWDFDLKNYSRMMFEYPRRTIAIVSAAYCALSVLVAVASSGAIASLASAYFRLGFPWSRRWLAGTRFLLGRARTVRLSFERVRLEQLATAVGSLILVVAAGLGMSQVTWMMARLSPGGNLPFVNFPGPKVWIATSLAGMSGRYSWEPILTETALLVGNIAAVFFLTYRAAGLDALRRWARWAPIVSIGAGFGLVVSSRSGQAFGLDISGPERTEFHVFTTLLCEVPATLLLYAVMSRKANEMGRAALARRFHRLAFVIFGMILISTLGFTFGVTFLKRFDPEMVALAALFGAVSLGIGVWATTAVLQLAGAAICDFAGVTIEPAVHPVAIKEVLRETERLMDGLDDEEIGALA